MVTIDSIPGFSHLRDATPAQLARLKDAQNAVTKADYVLVALRSLDELYLGFAVSQLTHALQTASRAETAGADAELVVAALCHDIGRVLPAGSHAVLAATLLRPHVRSEVYNVVRAHWHYELRYTASFIEDGTRDARNRFRRRPWHDLAARFADEWDQASFDPNYDTPPLSYFEHRVREVFGRTRNAMDPVWKQWLRPPYRQLRQLLGY
jgi:predicted HD phosphohydrolase